MRHEDDTSSYSNYLNVENVSKNFTHGAIVAGEVATEPILDGLSLTIPVGEFCTVFGPNGCGKSTLLNLLAGLIEPDEGQITINGQRPFPGQATYVFQNFTDTLLPWRTVQGNLLFPLECRSESFRERQAILKDFIEQYEFSIPLTARVYELSVGQQQMVSLARALVTRPRFVLMDEPFSALDFNARRGMQDKLLRYWVESKATILLVSHEIDEAIYLGQRLLLFPPRPVASVHEIPISLPNPRERKVLYTEECFRIRSEALRFFDDHVKANN